MKDGRQINYYITEEEIVEFDEYLTDVKAMIIGLPLDSETIMTLPAIRALSLHNFKWPLAFRLVPEEMANEIKTQFVEKQGYYLIDTLRSPIIEMSKCYFDFDAKIIRRARLYYQGGYYDENKHWIKKDRVFTHWAAEIAREFVRNHVNIKTNTLDYISPKVYELVNWHGWKLVEQLLK